MLPPLGPVQLLADLLRREAACRRGQLDRLDHVGVATEVDGGVLGRQGVLVQVLKSVYVQEPSLVDGRVGFGTSVSVEEANGRRTSYEIVGPDEVEPARRQISVASPVARALLGKRAGDMVVLRRPRGDIEVTVVSVTVAPGDVAPPPATVETPSDDADRRER